MIRKHCDVERPGGQKLVFRDVKDVRVKSGMLEIVFGEEEFDADRMGLVQGQWLSYRVWSVEE